jgi:hypothetical protein
MFDTTSSAVASDRWTQNKKIKQTAICIECKRQYERRAFFWGGSKVKRTRCVWCQSENYKGFAGEGVDAPPRKCTRCKLVRPVSDFYFNKSHDRYNTICAPCACMNSKQVREAFRDANPIKPRIKAFTDEQIAEVERHLDNGVKTYRELMALTGHDYRRIQRIVRFYLGRRMPMRERHVKRKDPEILERIRHLVVDLGISRRKAGYYLDPPMTPSSVCGLVWRYGLADMFERPEKFVVINGPNLRQGQRVWVD